ncbi:MAG: NAD(P)/FAD-dependent oxidoreductase [Alphaproteobacteria bacterium]
MTPGYDVACIGGGLVGAAVAYGLQREGARVALLDQGDVAYRASRGNFGLVWVQSKGLGMPEYAAWTKRSSDSWAGLQAMLREETGIDASFERPGGLHICLSEAELQARVDQLKRLHNQRDMVQYDWQALDRKQTAALAPGLGPDVAGATFCPIDGHANPLKLLRALHTAIQRRGGDYLSEHAAQRIEKAGDVFRIATSGGTVEAAKVVLTAGVMNATLAAMVGLRAPVRPQRGQILVSERVKPFLNLPISTIRQTNEGSVMFGDSLEETGFDDSQGAGVMATLASRAHRIFPFLGQVRIVRAWAALRVMSLDGFPVYEQSESHPGAYLATCHSGVTLAAGHALHLAPMIAKGALAPSMSVFSARRFDVPAAA